MLFFEELCIDLKNYNSEFGNDKRNFTGIKDKPLLKFSNDSYVIIDWNFFARKIYDGLLFTFYNTSGISDKDEFPDFMSFKKYLSLESVEKYLFRRIIKGCFKQKHSIVKFDDINIPGFPDAYVRKGNKIFLFEIKDAYFPSKVVDSASYQNIKEVIDQKYNNLKKGTGQLIKQIMKLKDNSYESLTYEQLGIKPRNFTIYPVIIYTDSYFSLPGVLHYLQEEFLNKIENAGVSSNFKCIKSLSFIDIDFLIENLGFIQSKEQSLDKLIDLVELELEKRQKKFKRTNSVEDLLELNDDFGSICSKLVNAPKSKRDYVKVLFDELELNRGLE